MKKKTRDDTRDLFTSDDPSLSSRVLVSLLCLP